MFRSLCKVFRNIFVLLLFPTLSFAAEEPLNVEDFLATKFKGETLHVYGKLTTVGPPELMMESAPDPLGTFRGEGLYIAEGKDPKLLQKMFIQCKRKVCSAKGVLRQTLHHRSYGLFQLLVLQSYSIGIDPNAVEVGSFVKNEIHGTPVFYEGYIDWGKSIEKSYIKTTDNYSSGIADYLSYTIDFSRLNETAKLALLDSYEVCKKVRIIGTYFNKSIEVDSFECQD